MSERERVYLSGAMRHRPYFQFPQFDYWRDKLTEAGYDVVSPADLDRAEGFDPIARNSENDQRGICDDVQDVRKLLRRDIDALSECHSLALLPDFTGSRGVKAEIAFCDATGMPVRMAEDLCR